MNAQQEFPPDDAQYFPLKATLLDLVAALSKRNLGADERALLAGLAVVAQRLPLTTAGADFFLEVGWGDRYATVLIEESYMEWSLGGVAHGEHGSDSYTSCNLEVFASSDEDPLQGDVLGLPEIAARLFDFLEQPDVSVSLEGSAELGS